jgi:hypothetical protein
MEYLRYESKLGHKSYKALFHEVSESSLLAVKKAKQKKKRDKKRKHDKQELNENLNMKTPNQPVPTINVVNKDQDLLDELTSHTVQLHVSSHLKEHYYSFLILSSCTTFQVDKTI